VSESISPENGASAGLGLKPLEPQLVVAATVVNLSDVGGGVVVVVVAPGVVVVVVVVACAGQLGPLPGGGHASQQLAQLPARSPAGEKPQHDERVDQESGRSGQRRCRNAEQFRRAVPEEEETGNDAQESVGVSLAAAHQGWHSRLLSRGTCSESQCASRGGPFSTGALSMVMRRADR